MKRKVEGVYLIRNTASGKVYVGSTEHLQTRFIEHTYELRNQKHRNTYLQRAWNRDGAESFTYEILEPIPGAKRKALRLREGYYIELHKSHLRGYGYNLCAINANGDDIVAPETIEKHRAAKAGKPCSEATKALISRQMTGKAKTASHRAAISEGKKGVPKTPEQIAKHKQAMSKKEYDLTNIITGERWQGKNLSEFAAERGLTKNNLYLVVNGKRPHAYGWYLTTNIKANGQHTEQTKPA